MESTALGMAVVGASIRVEVADKKGAKVLLNNVSFTAVPGELTAIMGPSGAGKTTLLSVIAGKSKESGVSISGQVLFGGQEVADLDSQDFIGFVRQEDLFLEHLTVRETVLFAARLKMKGKSYGQQVARAEELLKDLSLESCQHVQIGGVAFKGISGGQRKRVSIACALVNMPQVLILDEPTSGLDASLALEVMSTLDGLASYWNTTVICTIHQPRSQIFNFIDALILLRHGQCVYEGPCKDAAAFFAGIGHPVPDEYNPADFFLDILADQSDDADAAANFSSAELEARRETTSDDLPATPPTATKVVISAGAADKFSLAFAESPFAARRHDVQRDVLASARVPLPPERPSKRSAVLDWAGSVYILFLRGVTQNKRRPQNAYVPIGGAIFMSVVVSTIWWRKGTNMGDLGGGCDHAAKTRNLLGAILQVVANDIFQVYDCGTVIVDRRALINREASEHLYPRSAAYVANLLADGVFNYVGTFTTILIVYFSVGMKLQASAFFIWLGFLWLLKFTIIGYATLCGGIAPAVEAAMGLMPLGIVLMFMVAGLQISDNKVPKWLRWLQVLSPIRYVYQTVARRQFDEGYLDRCQGFETPQPVWENLLIVLGIAVFLRAAAMGVVSTMWKKQGLA